MGKECPFFFGGGKWPQGAMLCKFQISPDLEEKSH